MAKATTTIVSAPVNPDVKPVIKAVFHARVKAHSGKGQVTAVVLGQSGNCRLLGVTNLCKAGLLDMKHYGRFVKADKLAELLGRVPLISGADKCKAYLADNKIAGISDSDVLGDASGSVASDKAANDVARF